jgi:hypothetical protein
MTAWTTEELSKIGAAHELEIATLRADGTPRKPVTVWAVRLGYDLYIRSYLGAGAAWFRAAQARHQGHIRAGGVAGDVQFVEADRGLADQIDAAYRAKYTPVAPSYVDPMVSRQARATTLKLVPRS